jgi:hypothetical protein
MMLAFATGLRSAWHAVGARRAAVLLLLATGWIGTLALLARLWEPLAAPSATIEPACALVLPLSSFALVHRALRGADLADTVWAIGRHGLSRRFAALGVLVGTMLLSIALFTPALLAALVIAYGRTPGLVRDALTTGWIAGLGAGAYAAWFGLGSSVTKHGRGRWMFLALDFVLGGGTGALAAVFPRAHMTSLLGGPAVIDLSQRASSALLALGIFLLCAIAALRVPE